MDLAEMKLIEGWGLINGIYVERTPDCERYIVPACMGNKTILDIM